MQMHFAARIALIFGIAVMGQAGAQQVTGTPADIKKLQAAMTEKAKAD